MTKPSIALVEARFDIKIGSPTYQSRQVDIEAVLAAGGLPVLLPTSIPFVEVPALTAQFDGFYFTGGGDLDPLLFAEQSHERVYGVNPERDAFELALIREVVARDKLLLAVYRGMQTLNVVCPLPFVQTNERWATPIHCR